MVQSPSAAGVIEKQVRIDARPDVVYEFLTDAQKLARWVAPDVVADARPGGVIRMNFNGFDVMRGEFVELIPGKRVVYTWGWETLGEQPPPGSTTVEFTLEPDGAGTKVTLVHRGLAERSIESYSGGWDGFFAQLQQGIAGKTPTQTLSKGEAIASAVNAKLVQLRYAMESAPPSGLASLTAHEGWTVAATAHHVLDHCDTMCAVSPLLQGRHEELEAIALRQNAVRAQEFRAVDVDEIVREVCSIGPKAVETVRALSDADLARTFAFGFLGGGEMSLEQFLEPLAGTMFDHIESIKDTLSE
jgi:uncharacterized protein YndB with AHSA1/START domain